MSLLSTFESVAETASTTTAALPIPAEPSVSDREAAGSLPGAHFAAMPFHWGRSAARRGVGCVGDLRTHLPRFQRDDCCYRAVICDKAGTVVGVRSADYVLVQHDELLESLRPTLATQGFRLDDLPGELTIGGSGERVELVVHLPMPDLVPPDGHAVSGRLRCVNSVDGSTAIEAELQWYRQVCANGMWGWAGERVRRNHRWGNPLGWVNARLERQFAMLPTMVDEFRRMHDARVTPGSLRDWADVFVARRWGREAAAEVYHVCTTGRGGWVEDLPDRLPHQLELRAPVEVPGACAPALNRYHVGQALSWVAGRSPALHTRFKWLSQVPALLDHLRN